MKVVPDLETYFVSHAFAVLTALASLLMILRMLGTRRTHQSMVAWLLAIAFMPFLAISLYLLLGARKISAARKRPERRQSRDRKSSHKTLDW